MSTHLSQLTAPGPAPVAAPDQFVTFTAGENAFGIDIMSVREIRSWSPMTDLPGRPASSCGVLDIRGSVVEVHDLSALLNGPKSAAKRGSVVLVVALGETNVGILVDSVSDIIFAKPDNFRAAPAGDYGDDKVSGLVKQEERLVAILNLVTLFPGLEHTRLH